MEIMEYHSETTNHVNSCFTRCRFGTFGIYSIMFFRILKTLLEVLFFFIILIAAFAAAFCVLFQTLVFPDHSEYYPYRVSFILNAAERTLIITVALP